VMLVMFLSRRTCTVRSTIGVPTGTSGGISIVMASSSSPHDAARMIALYSSCSSHLR
jgi:hypothetical protein